MEPWNDGRAKDGSRDVQPSDREEGTERTVLNFRAAYVFDMADTDGNPLLELGNAERDSLRAHGTAESICCEPWNST